MSGGDRQRLDKWLWFARVVRTRVLAAELVETGHVRVNRQKVVKAGHAVRAGDVLTVAVAGHVRVLKILAHAPRRGPAASAVQLYEEAGMSNPETSAAQKEDATPSGNC